MSARRAVGPSPLLQRGVVAGAALSGLGDELAVTALLIGIHGSGGSGTSVATLLVAGLLPQVAVAPLAGHLVDRLETRRLVTAVSALQAVVLLAMAHAPSPGLLIAGCALLSAGAAVASTGTLSLLPALSGGRDGTRYLCTVQAAHRAGWALGPVLGALSSGHLGISWTLTLDAATFALFALLLGASGVRRPAAHPGLSPRGAELLAGVRAIWADRQLRVGFTAVVVATVGAGITNVTDVFLVKDVLARGSTAFGALVGLYAAGLVAGSYAARWIPDHSLLPSLARASAVAGVALAAPGILPRLDVAAVTYVTAGIGGGLALTLLRALLLKRVAPRAHGRAFSAQGAAGTAALAAALGLGALLVDTIGVRPTVVLAGLTAALPGAVILVWGRTPAATPSPTGPLTVGGVDPRCTLVDATATSGR